MSSPNNRSRHDTPRRGSSDTVLETVLRELKTVKRESRENLKADMRFANELNEVREKVKVQEEEIKWLKFEVKEEKAKRRIASRTGLFSRSIALDVRIRGENLKHVSRDLSACWSCIALVD